MRHDCCVKKGVEGVQFSGLLHVGVLLPIVPSIRLFMEAHFLYRKPRALDQCFTTKRSLGCEYLPTSKTSHCVHGIPQEGGAAVAQTAPHADAV